MPEAPMPLKGSFSFIISGMSPESVRFRKRCHIGHGKNFDIDKILLKPCPKVRRVRILKVSCNFVARYFQRRIQHINY